MAWVVPWAHQKRTAKTLKIHRAKFRLERTRAKIAKTIHILALFKHSCLLLGPCGSAVGISAACNFGKNRSNAVCFYIVFDNLDRPLLSPQDVISQNAKSDPGQVWAGKGPSEISWSLSFSLQLFCQLLGPCGPALGIPAACTFGNNRSTAVCFILFFPRAMLKGVLMGKSR